MDSEWVELTAFEESMNVAGNLNIMKVVFESDCRRGRDITILGHCVDKACMKLKNFSLVNVKWANWICNKTADFICNFELENNCSWNFNMNYPKEIHDYVIFDAIN
ncbi:hypothetical protein PVK06_013037 [Gossypium arboreum]|uniref:Uncharacterized protein n=1 Tax=Gossypium arboreum TaxID=29729 RepID=A0ABR0QDX9_GOSAR|nr:hypothetical protein PVK06_013037 [Gossypium arboreum]